MKSDLAVSPSTLDVLLRDVDKPARYTGGEINSVVKTDTVRARIALCFPDVYEVAESHLGLKILYEIVNNTQAFAAERVYAWWPDFEARAVAAGVPTFSLETRRPLAAFDVVGFTLQYELCYPTVVAMLDQGDVPIRAVSRTAEDPIVIGGGTGAFNPEPLAAFFDAFLLGDGEDAVLEILDVVARARARSAPRAETLVALAGITGIYVPSHFDVTYDGIAVQSIGLAAGAPERVSRTRHGTPRVPRRTLVDLDAAPFPVRPIVPNMQPVHDRVAVEIQRGCSKGCRFCHAGMVTRPTRQRRPQTVLRLADEALQATGCDSVGLLSLSAGDYQPMNQVLAAMLGRYQSERIGVSLPSMRTETMSPELAQRLAGVRKSGWTFAPEAGSERLRRVINKTNSEEDLLAAVRATVSAGWRSLKFYFMIGLPTETDDDVMAIAALAERALNEARRIRANADVIVSVSTFVPKPHTPFQWEAQIGIDETRDKQRVLRERLRENRITLRYHSPEQSFLEGVLSRGDRRLAPAIEQAARDGCRLDAWTDQYDHGRWMRALRSALEPHGLTPEEYLNERDPQHLLPWDHLDAGILKKFLLRDRDRARLEATVADCAFTPVCPACGGCDIADPYRADKQPLAQLRCDPAALRPRVFEPADAPLAAPAPPESAVARTVSAATSRSRLRFRYAKTGRAVHMSHLDAMEQILRALRRSGIPVLYSEGYTPRLRVGFSPACPSGIESRAEFFEAWCSGFPDPQAAAESLGPLFPDGLSLIEVQEVPRELPAFNEILVTTTYSAQLPDGADVEACAAALRQFHAAECVPVRVTRKRKPKLMDAATHIVAVELHGDCLNLALGFGRHGTLKIVEALALFVGPESARACRIRKEDVSLASGPRPTQEAPSVPPNLPAIDLTAVADRRAAPAPSGAVPYAE